MRPSFRQLSLGALGLGVVVLVGSGALRFFKLQSATEDSVERAKTITQAREVLDDSIVAGETFTCNNGITITQGFLVLGDEGDAKVPWSVMVTKEFGSQRHLIELQPI